MTTAFAIELVDEVNARLDAINVLEAVDFHADKAQHAGETIKAFCPIHKDSRFRSLLVDAERHAFRCTVKTCQGYSGGSLIELYALATGEPILKAACDLAQRFNLELGEGWLEGLRASYLEEAEAARAREDFTEAESLLSELTEMAPEMIEARVELASLHSEMGNSQAAAEELVRVIDDQVSAGNLDEAAALTATALGQFPANEDLQFASVRVAEAQGDEALAVDRMLGIIAVREAENRSLDNIGLLEQLVEKVSDRPDLAIKLGGLYEQQHNVRAASRQYEAAATAYKNAGQVEQAAEWLDKVVQFNSENSRARLELAGLMLEIGQVDAAREHTFRVVNQNIDNQEFGPAVTTINGWLEHDPDSVPARELMARVYMEQERSAEAATSLVEGAELAAAAGDHTAAAELLLRAKYLTPEDINLRRRLIDEFKALDEQQRGAFEIIDLAEMLFASDQPDAARELLNNAIASSITVSLKLQMITTLANRGVEEMAGEKLNELAAEAASAGPEVEAEYYELVSRLQPADIGPHLRQVQLLWETAPGRAVEAAADSAQVLLEHSNPDGAAEIIAFIADHLDGDLPEAKRLVLLAGEAGQPDLAGRLYTASIQGVAEEDPQAALNLARWMERLQPAHPSAASDIAYLLATLGHTAEAAAQYAKVAEMLLHGGDHEAGLQFAREAVALAPESVPALAAQARLASVALPPDEARPLIDELLSALQTADDPGAVESAYLAATEIYPEDLALIDQAVPRLSELGRADAAATVQARKGALLARQGQWDAAAKALKEAIDFAPHLAEIQEQYGEACRITGESDMAAGAFAEAALGYVERDAMDDATRCITSAEVAGPASTRTWERIFLAAQAVGRDVTALAAATNLTDLYSASESPAGMVRWAREWIDLAPQNPEAWQKLARALTRTGQAENAIQAHARAAEFFFSQEKFAEAVASLQPVISAGAASADDCTRLQQVLGATDAPAEVRDEAALLLGTAYIQQKDLEAATAIADEATDSVAGELWGRLARIMPDNASAAEAYEKAGNALVRSDEKSKAATILQEAASAGISTPGIHRLLANLLTDLGRTDEAFPHQVEVLKEAARGDAAALEKLLDQLETIYAKDPSALTEIAQVLLFADKRDRAMHLLELAANVAIARNDTGNLIKICGLDEDLTRRSSILTAARADALMGQENEQQALEWITGSTRNLLEQGSYEEALQMSERWISLQPRSIEARRAYATACEHTGREQDSSASIQKLAEILVNSGDPSAAVELLDELLSKNPDDLQALGAKIEAQKNAGDSAGAADSVCALARLQEKAGKTEAALESYIQCLTLRPGHTPALRKQAELTHALQGAAAALPIYHKWLQTRKQEVAKADWIEDLQVVTHIFPESSALHKELATALVEENRGEDALPHLEKLADAAESEGDFTTAAEALEQVIALTALPAAAQHVRAGNLHERAGRNSLAQDHLRAAAKLLQQEDDLPAAVKALEKLLALAGDSALPEDIAVAAKTHGQAGNRDRALELMSRAIERLDTGTGNPERKEKLLDAALSLDPLNAEYVIRLMEIWPASRAMSEGLQAASAMEAAGHHDSAIEVLTRVIALAPHDMSLRQQLFAPLRATKNKTRLRQELMTLANDALAAGDIDAAVSALDEAATLVTTPQQKRALAELNERGRRLEEAAKLFTAAAMAFAEADKNDQAIANVNRAISAKPGAVPAETLAVLVGRIGKPLYDITREQLRTQLTARKQKQSQMLALALIAAVPQRTTEILKTVYTLGGSSILAGIAHLRVESLLEAKNTDDALELIQPLLEIAPDVSDIWHLSSRVNTAAGNTEEAVRSAMEAARLYAIAGAVIEEEESYRDALKVAPSDSGVLTTFAEFLVREHRPDEAVGLLQEVIDNAILSGNEDLQLEALNRAVQIAPANTDLREKLARLLERIAPDSAVDNWLQTAAAYHESGEHDRARRTYQHVLRLNPGNETALHQLVLSAREDADLMLAAKLTKRLAEIKAARRNVGEACRLLQAHLEIDPDNLSILEQLAALAGASNDNEVFATTTRALARKFQKAGDSANALQHYEKLYERTPRDMQLLTTLIDCCAAAGNAEKGVGYARELMAIARETEDPEKIRLAAATILNYDDSDAVAHRELAESLLGLNRVTEAVTQFLRAAEYFESTGNNTDAYSCYRKVTQISPSTTQAWRRLAELSLALGDLETAQRSVLHLLEAGSHTDTSRIKPLVERLVQHTADMADVHQAALEYYRRVDDTDSAAQEALWLAQDAVVKGNADRAERFFSEALKLDPRNKDITTAHYEFIKAAGRLEELQLRLRNQSEQHLANNETAEAIAVLQELSGLAPGQISVHRDIARLLEQEDRYSEALDENLTVIRLLLQRSELEEARDAAEKLVEKYKEESDCRERVADLLAETAYPDLAARYYSTAAQSAVKAENFEDGIHLLKKAVNARPLWTEARNMLAATYEKAGKPEEAFQAWIDLVPVLMESGEFLEATSTLNRLSNSYPDSPEVREQLADLYEKTGRRDEFIKTLHDLAAIYEKSDDAKRALAIYHRLTEAEPDDAHAISRYLELSAEIGSHDGDFSDEYTRLADVLARSGDVQGAFQTYEQVLAQSPENTTARSRYAAFLLSRGSRNRALTEMRALSKLYMDRKESTAAVEVLNAALTIAPRDADLCLALARAQEAAGMLEDARISYSRASAILANTAAVKGIDTYRRILSVDENNTAVRLRLVEVLMRTDDKMEAAREARLLAEIHISRGELAEAEHAYSLVDQCDPQTKTEIREAINRDSYDPSLQYLHYVRLGNCLFSEGDVDGALDAYRTARSLHDDQVQLIQKCIDCVSLIAPEAEAIPDYLVMAEKYLLAGKLQQAHEAYSKVRMIDPFNNDARCGIESVEAMESQSKTAAGAPAQDDLVLKTSRSVNKRVALMDLLVACQDAADQGDNAKNSAQVSGDDRRL